MAKKKPKGEDQKAVGEERSLSNAKPPVVIAEEKVVELANTTKEEVASPVVEVEEVVKKKRPRFVREKKEKTQTEASQLTPRSTTQVGKMMSKNIIPPLKAETELWPKTKRKP